jgi:transcriptional regulator with GAF, ATPase, and Fis domain
VKSRKSSHEVQQFKDTLFELSTGLINAPANEIGNEVDKAIALIAGVWDFEAVLFSELTDDRCRLIPVHSYTAPGVTMPPFSEGGQEIPWLMEESGKGKTVALSRLPDDLPAGATSDRGFCLRAGIKSSLTLPFGTDDSGRRGILSVLSFSREHAWTEEQIKTLRYAGQILINALERKKTTSRIHELLQFERLLSEVSATYINLPRDEVEKVLRRDFERLSTLLGVDRCVLYRVGKNMRFTRLEKPFFWSPDEDAEAIRELDEWSAEVPNLFDNLQYFFDKWYKGEHLEWTRLEDLPHEAERVKQLYARFGVKSGIAIPVSVNGATIAALVVTTVRVYRTWSPDLIPRLRLFGEVFANAIMRKRNEEEIQSALSEIRSLKERIEADYIYLREEINLEHGFGNIVGKSDSLTQILVKAKQVAPTNATVLLLGETGTGKGLIARAIHNASNRKDRPFMQVNCAALTPSLIESELFGHEKGAFTGATAKRIGRFEAAHGTTLFLDEIGDLPLELQPKLLRVLQDGEFERVGGSTTVKCDVRVIAATNRDLEKEVEEGRFRRDLWYRLSIFPISIPPLRERLDDIPLFLGSFVKKYGMWIGKQFQMVPLKTIRALQNYPWPGNIRELENLVERAVITSPDGSLQIEVPSRPEVVTDSGKTLREFEKDHILKALEETNWTIEGPNGAARRLGLKPSTLRFRAKKLDIRRPRA